MSLDPFLNDSTLPNLQIIFGDRRLCKVPKYVHVDAGFPTLDLTTNRKQTDNRRVFSRYITS